MLLVLAGMTLIFLHFARRVLAQSEGSKGVLVLLVWFELGASIVCFYGVGLASVDRRRNITKLMISDTCATVQLYLFFQSTLCLFRRQIVGIDRTSLIVALCSLAPVVL